MRRALLLPLLVVAVVGVLMTWPLHPYRQQDVPPQDLTLQITHTEGRRLIWPLPSDAPVLRRFTVRNCGEDTLVLDAAGALINGTHTPFVLAPGSSHPVLVTWQETGYIVVQLTETEPCPE